MDVAGYIAVPPASADSSWMTGQPEVIALPGNGLLDGTGPVLVTGPCRMLLLRCVSTL